MNPIIFALAGYVAAYGLLCVALVRVLRGRP